MASIMNSGSNVITFRQAFAALTGHTPMPWQTRVYECLLNGGELSEVSIPTGLGKTSVMAIWLIALSQQAAESSVTLPRRLFYVVNRRTVVDQATSEVNGIRERLLWPGDRESASHSKTLVAISRSLARLSRDGFPLAISTLRGELADNEEWKINPAGAAVIIGTVDMIGSRLLFSGYGDGPYQRPQHAGLIGQDSLIVHDEAHLTSPFGELLRRVEAVQRDSAESRPIRILELSATLRNKGRPENSVTLESGDFRNRVVRQRMDAKKLLRLSKQPDKGLAGRIAELAFRHDDARAKVLIYVSSPKEAQDVVRRLRGRGYRAGDRVAILAGPIRGHERDRLVTENTVYRHLLDPEWPAPDKTVYLVSTSAGEVGLDADADHMVSSPSSLEAVLQRIGRVNRRGLHAGVSEIDLLWTPAHANPKRAAGHAVSVSNTLRVLGEWTTAAGGELDVSPRNIFTLLDALEPEDRLAAFSPTPETPYLSDMVLDDWSLTSVNDLADRMDVAPFLHGMTLDPPDTRVVWRQEVRLFTDHDVVDESIAQWFRICPPRTGERLTDSTANVRTWLRRLLRAHRKRREDELLDFNVVVLDSHRDAARLALSSILDNASQWRIQHATIVLPVEIGGLDENGMLSGSSSDSNGSIDVADGADRMRLFPGSPETPPADWRERGRVTLLEASEESDEEAEVRIVLLMPDSTLAVNAHELARFDQSLDTHTRAIVSSMESIGKLAGLPPPVLSALTVASRWHDQGKDRLIWQRYARKSDESEPYAKSSSYRAARSLGGYRHELGSLLDAMRDDEVQSHPERDLVLHLIASHHGRARPHFLPIAFDREKYSTLENSEAAAESMRRFGQLQRRFGRWGLAWLESLMRSADIAASRKPGTSPYVLLHSRGGHGWTDQVRQLQLT